MSVQRLIDSRFWSDNFVVDKLNPLDRYLFLYFLTNEKTNICGVYEIPLRTISNETGIEKEEIIRMMKRLKGKVEYKDGWVCIVNFVKHQSTKSLDVQRGIEKLLNSLPSEIYEWVRGCREGLGTVPRQPEVSNLIKSNLIKSNLKTKRGEYDSNFEEFWNEYPEKIAKGKAWDSWCKLTEEEKLLTLPSIRSQVLNNHFRNKRGEDYIPHPTTWLNQRRWEDEVKVLVESSKAINLNDPEVIKQYKNK